MKPKFKYIFALLIIMILMAFQLTSLANSDHRNAGQFKPTTSISKDGTVYISNQNGQRYYPNNKGGLTVYVPYNDSYSGKLIFKNMFLDLFNIYETGDGDNYDAAGGKFIVPAPELMTLKRKNTSNYVKKVALGGLNENLGPIVDSIPAKTDIKQLSPNFNVEFRYAGIMIDSTNESQGGFPGTVVTNPSFPSDTLHASNDRNGEAREYQVFDKNGQPLPNQSVTMYGTKTLEVIQRSQFQTNWNGVSGVPTNRKSIYNDNLAMAEASFEKWAEFTNIGAAYKAAYSTDPSGKPWWQILNNYMRIDGNFEKQSVLFTAVYKEKGHVYYITYGIPYPVENNMIASKIQILDDQGTVLDYSERPLAIEEAISGADDCNKNVKTDGAVKLERNKTYTVEYAFTFASHKKNQTFTNKDLPGAISDIKVVDQTADENTFKTYNASPANEIQNLSSEEAILLDRSVHGPIHTRQLISITLTRNSVQTVDYRIGLTVYKNRSFTVDETFPSNGTIRITIPELYAQNGDNDYLSDDSIELDYTIGESEKKPDAATKDSYGDLNLGRRELRRYHHKVTVEEKDPDNPILDEKGEIKGYHKKKVDYEYASDFGTYTSPSKGKEVGSWSGVPEASGSIYPIDGSSWWEYDQKWPDQSDDMVYKIWLKKGHQSWKASDEDYTRSETSDHPFDLGFSVSRSRGQSSDQINPHLIVSVYGISPETEDDGTLIETYRVTGPSIGTYQYSSKNYLYLLNNYIARRYASRHGQNDDYPRIRVTAEIDPSYHGESGIYGDAAKSPYHNGWQTEHDTCERVFKAKSDDMELTDVKIKDAEGIIVYHATRGNGGGWVTKVKGYFDKEGDYTLSVKLRQNKSAGHIVKNPTIDVTINGQTEDGGTVSTYVDRVIEKNGTALGLGQEISYENIAFRPKNVSNIQFHVEIDSIHGANGWRENKWRSSEDSLSDRIQCTTANLKVSPDIELYNSKNNKKDYLSFAEKLNFKFDIQHIGQGTRQTSVVGNSDINPLPKLDIAIYNVDLLTKDEYGNLVYKNVKQMDPKATGALLWTGTATAKSRLFPGMGEMNYSTHVQAWINNYVVQSWETLSGNQAAYGRILVTANVNREMHLRGTNTDTSQAEDYVQKEFVGEHNLSISDMAVTGMNSRSDNSWYYQSINQDPNTGKLIQPNKNGISVSVAIRNMTSAHTDPMIVDRTYLDIYLGDAKTPVKTILVDLPQGRTIPVEVVLPDVLITNDLKVTAKVNEGKHQTHYEYVLPSTDTSLNKDPFIDNVSVRTIRPNLPDKEHAPNANIINGLPPEIK